jgi:hypothetical protein
VDHYKIVAGAKVDPAVAEDRDLTPTGMRQLFAQAPEWARYVQTATLGEKKRQPPPRTYPYAGPGSPLDEYPPRP